MASGDDNPYNLIRPRRLRRSEAIRNLVSSTEFRSENLVLPIFVKEDLTGKFPIASMPGVSQHDIDSAIVLIGDAIKVGIRSFAIFGIPKTKDTVGKYAVDPDGILQRALKTFKNKFQESVVLIPDLCLDEFLTHGHCGILNSNNQVDNDATVDIYTKMAVTLADSGADLVAPSGMMDNQVAAIREALDASGNIDCGILAYSVKFASNAYGPFRDAVQVTLDGDRRTYQQDFRRSSAESVLEARLDVSQGADVVMVKPAIFNLDIISQLKSQINVPIFAYQVSGEYSMIKTCAEAGFLSYMGIMYESLSSIFRAGATAVLTYGAMDIARHLQEG
jgi:porphobilinogen synthase